MAGKKPDYNVYLSDKEVPEGRLKRRFIRIGAAWKNRNGDGLMININPGVVIDHTLLEKFNLGLFENDEQRRMPSTGDRLNLDDVGGDIPF